MTQEFHLSVTPIGHNDYLLRTEQVAPGVPLAEELVTWPVSEWLTSARHLMNDPIKSVLEGQVTDRKVNLADLGREFYNAIFQGTLRDSWITAQGIAQNQQESLHLRLAFKDTRLARLPWEVMYTGDRPLATGPYVTFSRYQCGSLGQVGFSHAHRFTPSDTGVVKVLMVLASPPDQERLDLLKQEAIKLKAELERSITPTEGANNKLPDIQLTLLDQPGREELTQALEKDQYQILHYSGHSSLGSNGGKLYLVSRKTGLTETLSGDDLAGLLVNNNIQIAVFNSCWGTYTATSAGNDGTAERNLTESLVKRGIRGVLAMSERIPDEVAVTVTQLFYRRLKEGHPIDLCVSRVRQGLISAYGSQQNYWALPILYLQQDFDGFLCARTPSNSDLLTGYAEQWRLISNSPTTQDHYRNVSPHLEGDYPEQVWLDEEIDFDEYSDYEKDAELVSSIFTDLNYSPTDVSFPHTQNPDAEIQENTAPPENKIEASDLWGEMPSSTNDSRRHRQKIPDGEVYISNTNKKTRKRLHQQTTIGVFAILTITGLMLWMWPQKQETTTKKATESTNTNIAKSAPERISDRGRRKFNEGDLQGGLGAVKELLESGDTNEAEKLLSLVPRDKIDHPQVNFIKGRLAWQSIQMGNTKYSPDDARRYWETGLQSEPNSSFYTNALGFAYYREGNLHLANDAWFKAANMALEAQPGASNVSLNINEQETDKQLPQDAMTAYAGLALSLYKLAPQQQNNHKEKLYISEAVKLRELLMKHNKSNFDPSKLSQDWLWTEEAIADWQSLLRQNIPN